jgi:hypothetical protein
MDEELAKYPELLSIAQEMRAEGCGIEEILEALRERSPSVIQSIKAIRDTLHIPLSEAKLLVHRSRAWSDMRDVFSEVHELAEAEYADMTSDAENGQKEVRVDLSRKRKPPHD